MSTQHLHLSPIIFYLLSLQIFQTYYAKGSSHLKLDFSTGNIVELDSDRENCTDFSAKNEYRNSTFSGATPYTQSSDTDRAFAILTTRKLVDRATGYWTVIGFSSQDEESLIGQCGVSDHGCLIRTISSQTGKSTKAETTSVASVSPSTPTDKNLKTQTPENFASTTPEKKKDTIEREPFLDCGKPVTSTLYDHLSGVSNRSSHPSLVEREAAVIFKKFRKKGTDEVDMNVVERDLKKKPKSVQLYNQIGNFWRVKGNTQLAIECFRKALYVAPNSADVLQNLARVLFNLKYLDDAMFLSRKSLEIAAPTRNVCLQHVTLGEIHQAYGSIHEAKNHYLKALEVNPNCQKARSHLEKLEDETHNTPAFTLYTFIVAALLVFSLALGVLSSFDQAQGLELSDSKSPAIGQRHFNRAFAMRSMRVGLNGGNSHRGNKRK